MNTFFALIIGIAIAVIIWIISVTVIVANVNIIISEGHASFWPIAWILLFAGGSIGGTTRALK